MNQRSSKFFPVFKWLLCLSVVATPTFAAPLGQYRFEDFGCRIGGFCIYKAKGSYHIVYTRGLAAPGQTWNSPGNGVDLGHAMSRDLRSWNIAAPFLKVKPGTWDERSVWSPCVVELNKLFYLYYTGVNLAASERIGLATSDDFLIWGKTDANPVLTPPEWTGFSAESASTGRDPSVLIGEDTHYLYYSTIQAGTGSSHLNAIGVAESHDLIRWQDKGAAITSDKTLESPSVFKRGEVYYLIAGGTESRAWRSADPVEGWEPLAMAFPAKLSRFEIFQDGDAFFLAGVETRSSGDVVWISPIRWETDRPIVVHP